MSEETFEKMMEWEINNLDNIEKNLNSTCIELFKRDCESIEILEQIYR